MLKVSFNRDGSIKQIKMNSTERGQLASAAGLLMAIGRCGCEESGMCLDAAATIHKVVTRYCAQPVVTASQEPSPLLDGIEDTEEAPFAGDVPVEPAPKATDKDQAGMYAGGVTGGAT